MVIIDRTFAAPRPKYATVAHLTGDAVPATALRRRGWRHPARLADAVAVASWRWLWRKPSISVLMGGWQDGFSTFSGGCRPRRDRVALV